MVVSCSMRGSGVGGTKVAMLHKVRRFLIGSFALLLLLPLEIGRVKVGKTRQSVKIELPCSQLSQWKMVCGL